MCTLPRYQAIRARRHDERLIAIDNADFWRATPAFLRFLRGDKRRYIDDAL